MDNKFHIKTNYIVIDADGCPVVRLAVKIAKQFGTSCKIVCDTAHTFNIDGASCIIVSQGADSADFYIVNHIQHGDIVITQDYGLATMCMAKNATVVNQDGKIYTNENIIGLLETRAAAKKIRNSGMRVKGMKGPKKRTEEQNINFEKTLRRLLENAEI